MEAGSKVAWVRGGKSDLGSGWTGGKAGTAEWVEEFHLALVSFMVWVKDMVRETHP